MTYFINLRASDYGTVLPTPQLFESPGQPPNARIMQPFELASAVKGRDVVIATHGFNVGYVYGLQSLANLDRLLALAPAVYVGVLWPGDWVVPAVNYPFAVGIAREAGKRLGAFLKLVLVGARSVSFISHSLGARVILEATEQLGRPAKSLCITAGAVNADALSTEYLQAAGDAVNVVNLASGNDLVLKLAYPAGDLIAEILSFDHNPFEQALGAYGPVPPLASNVRAYEITAQSYDHGDYLPPDVLPTSGTASKWGSVVTFMRSAVTGQAQVWPTP